MEKTVSTSSELGYVRVPKARMTLRLPGELELTEEAQEDLRMHCNQALAQIDQLLINALQEEITELEIK